ncbi:MFS transporter [Nonomuraea polychroma]|uniref:MFS transporter n=1 Tax=Nonomuraea polychroma TaxID=46176 RepID=UPI003D8CB21B
MTPEETTGEGSPEGSGGGWRRIRRLRRNVELNLLWTGSAVSTFGTRTLSVAYPLLALAEGNSPIAAGWAGFAFTIPILILYIPGGLLVDRISPRRVMLVAEFVRGLTVGTVLLTMIFGHLSLIHIMIAAAVEGAMWALYTLAESSLLPSLAHPGTMMRRVLAKSEGATHVGSLLGRPVGGYLFGLGSAFPFALNTALFVVSWGLFLSVRRSSERTPAGPSQLRDLSGGFRELMRQPFLRSSILLITITNLVINTLMMVFVAGSHGLSSLSIGVVLAAGGVGGAVGAGLAFFRSPPRSVLLVHMCIWGFALFLAALGTWVGAWLPFFAAAFFITGMGGAWSNVAIREVEVNRIDPRTLARVVGVSRLSAHAAICLAAPLGGLLVTWYGVTGGASALFVVMMSAIVLISCSPKAREALVPRLPGPLSQNRRVPVPTHAPVPALGVEPPLEVSRTQEFQHEPSLRESSRESSLSSSQPCPANV